MLPPRYFWSSILNLIIEQYLEGSTICLIWPKDNEFQFRLKDTIDTTAVININPESLEQSFAENVVDFKVKRKQMMENGVFFNDFVEKLTTSIEKSHCETFLAFQQDIPMFIEAFVNASKYSIWRSQRNKFIFAYYNVNGSDTADFTQHSLFQEQPSILVIVANCSTTTKFNLRTNKYIGPRADNQKLLYLLDEFDAETGFFKFGNNLFPDKLQNLQDREVVIAAYDYSPYAFVMNATMEGGHKTARRVRDLANPNNEHVYIDGTEIRCVLAFCDLYNCTVEIDSSETYDWGVMYPNTSGTGTLGMIGKGKAEVGLGAMYTWYEDYTYLDMSINLGRSGITCMVPAPRRLASWFLPIEPFQSTLWAAVFICLVLESIVLFLLRKFQQLLTAEESSWLGSCRFGIVTTFKLFISQPSTEAITSFSLRMMLLACFMNDIIITSIYGGGLASILTIPSYEEAADTVERLETHQLQWAGNSVAWVLGILGTNDTLMNAILKNYHIYSDEEIARLSMTANIGFTMERLPFGHYALNPSTPAEAVKRFKIMQEDIYFQYTVVFVSRIWPLLQRFDRLINIWHSSGFDKCWEWRMVFQYADVQIQKQIEASILNAHDDVGPVKLGMSNFAGIILVWVLGILISIAVFISELFYFKSMKKKKGIQFI